MNTRWPWGILCVLAACEPLPPEPTQNGQTPEFTVLTKTPSIGSLDFSITSSGHLEGTLVLGQDVASTHPLLLSVVWIEPETATGLFSLSGPPLHQADQQLLGTFSHAAGTQSVTGDISLPPDAVRGTACGASATGTVVLFVDLNENGILDLTPGAPIDHVISSSDVPTLIFGDHRFQKRIHFEGCGEPHFAPDENVHQLIYENPLLDLVSCTNEERFADPSVCGSNLITNAVWFKGERKDHEVTLYFDSFSQVTVIIDGLTRGIAIRTSGAYSFDQAEMGIGQHKVRLEGAAGYVWEATFTLPDRTWIRAARPVGPGEYEVHFQEIIGATSYQAEGGGQLGRWEVGTSSPIRVPAQFRVGVVASFGELPFSVRADASLDR